MMTPDQIADAARRLDEAERTRKQIRDAVDHPGMDMADAYSVQNAWIDLKLAAGRKVLGHKIGLRPPRPCSRRSTSTCRIPATCFDDMFFADGAHSHGQFIGLRIEAEVAFVLKAPLRRDRTARCSTPERDRLCRPGALKFSIRASRCVDPETKKTRLPFDTIADNAANCGIVTGGRPIRPDHSGPALDRRHRLRRMARVEEMDRGRRCWNHPPMRPAWLANRLAEHGGAPAENRRNRAGRFVHPADRGSAGRYDRRRLGLVMEP